jgi:hypothetical protein
LHIDTLPKKISIKAKHLRDCSHVAGVHRLYRRMGPVGFQCQAADYTTRKDFASSSSTPPLGAGLSEREGATEAMDGTRLGGILLI